MVFVPHICFAFLGVQRSCPDIGAVIKYGSMRVIWGDPICANIPASHPPFHETETPRFLLGQR